MSLSLCDGTLVDVTGPALPLVEVTGPDGTTVSITVPAATLADLAAETTARQDADAAHVIDPAPHPAYDDLPSFALLFENGLI